MGAVNTLCIYLQFNFARTMYGRTCRRADSYVRMLIDCCASKSGVRINTLQELKTPKTCSATPTPKNKDTKNPTNQTDKQAEQGDTAQVSSVEIVYAKDDA